MGHQPDQLPTLQGVWRIWSSPRITKKRTACKMKLQQEVEGLETRMGLQENRHHIQGAWRLQQMTVWGLGQVAEQQNTDKNN